MKTIYVGLTVGDPDSPELDPSLKEIWDVLEELQNEYVKFTDLSKVKRFEVIVPGVDRLVVEYDAKISFDLQDDEETLKIFIYK